jgi:ribosomal protein L44E|tara:strand:- start:403 stop:690 length:288 start_codon:yes stop_codon:yes gene_type:complete
MSLERKLRRKQAKKGKKRAEKELATKVALFGHLPNKCLTCETPFDKLDREQVMSWNVVVRQKEEKVNLYCPQCWDNAQQTIKKYMEDKDAVLPTT